MLENLFAVGMVDTGSFAGVLICTAASLIFGMGTAGIYMYRNTYAKNFVITLTLLPAMVQLVIMLVNGNVGAGVAVMGAFSLVRFRSIPGSAKEIGSIFMAMAVGLAAGMGALGIAAMFLLIVGAANIALSKSPFGEQKKGVKNLKITIPENLDYTEIFDDLFQEYTEKTKLCTVRTTNLGSLYELRYQIVLKDVKREKEFLDELRCRNGNLSIVCGRLPEGKGEL